MMLLPCSSKLQIEPDVLEAQVKGGVLRTQPKMVTRMKIFLCVCGGGVGRLLVNTTVEEVKQYSLENG